MKSIEAVDSAPSSQPATTVIVPRRRSRLILSLAFVMVSIAYLAQIATPLRLINDGIDYLLQASSAIDGNGFLVHGTHSMRPPGYPKLIFVLAKGGIGKSWAIVALNCLLLGIGCWASYFVMRDSFEFSREVAQLISLLTLFSFLMVRNVTYPLSDVCFFGASVACVLLLIRIERQGWSRRLRSLIFVIPLVLFCIELRTIGVVLIPAFLWTAIGGAAGARTIYPSLRRHRLVSLALLLVVIVTSGKVLLDSLYLQFNLPTLHHRGILRSVAVNLRDKTTEWGEMTVNAPVSKLPGALGWPLRIVGAFAILACAVGIWGKRKSLDSLLVYVLGFAGIVFAYPWFDTRLWLPVVPFLMAYVLLGLGRMFPPGMVRPVMVAYCACFCLLGVVALGFSTRVTFAGPRFPDIYGDGNFRGTYALVLRGEAPKSSKDIDPDALYLLRRYEWRVVQ